ncbi:MAG: DUF4271 domain-containing protein, partial [Bacteroidia bacterium]
MNYEPLFKDHLLAPHHTGAMFNSVPELYWPPVLLFIVFGMMVVLKVTAPVKTLRILNAAYSLQVARQVEREDYSPFKRISVLLSLVFVFTLAFLLFKLNELYGSVLNNNSSLFQYLFFVLVVIMAYTIKFIMINIIGALTGMHQLLNEYVNNTLIINQTVGLLLFPVVTLAQLSFLNPVWLIFPGVLFVLLGYLMRLYRGFVFAAMEEGVGFLQLFVYLC